MKFARNKLDLPVPKVHRTFEAKIRAEYEQNVKAHFIVMDYVSGPTVDECWDSLDSSQRQSVVAQVATVIKKMQSRHLERELPPGPIGKSASRRISPFGYFRIGLFSRCVLRVDCS